MKNLYTLLLLAICLAGTTCKKSNSDDVATRLFSVVTTEADQCGYLLRQMCECPICQGGIVAYIPHIFVYAKNLPKEYRENNLRVQVTYRITKEEGGSDCKYAIINIIKIQKQ